MGVSFCESFGSQLYMCLLQSVFSLSSFLFPSISMRFHLIPFIAFIFVVNFNNNFIISLHRHFRIKCGSLLHTHALCVCVSPSHSSTFTYVLMKNYYFDDDDDDVVVGVIVFVINLNFVSHHITQMVMCAILFM